MQMRSYPRSSPSRLIGLLALTLLVVALLVTGQSIRVLAASSTGSTSTTSLSYCPSAVHRDSRSHHFVCDHPAIGPMATVPCGTASNYMGNLEGGEVLSSILAELYAPVGWKSSYFNAYNWNSGAYLFVHDNVGPIDPPNRVWGTAWSQFVGAGTVVASWWDIAFPTYPGGYCHGYVPGGPVTIT